MLLMTPLVFPNFQFTSANPIFATPVLPFYTNPTSKTQSLPCPTKSMKQDQSHPHAHSQRRCHSRLQIWKACKNSLGAAGNCGPLP
uniref:Uncharacterized protein n=1 Tax=Physcomitrium patens TaxID=3218 RepID=A0A2K1IXP3_PHYPA|nr:hypothetical protein PHYPA_023852 [Physcomitrium patens]